MFSIYQTVASLSLQCSTPVADYNVIIFPGKLSLITESCIDFNRCTSTQFAVFKFLTMVTFSQDYTLT